MNKRYKEIEKLTISLENKIKSDKKFREFRSCNDILNDTSLTEAEKNYEMFKIINYFLEKYEDEIAILNIKELTKDFATYERRD